MDSHLGKYVLTVLTVPYLVTSVSRYPWQADKMPWKQRQRGFWYNRTQWQQQTLLYLVISMATLFGMNSMEGDSITTVNYTSGY